MHTSIKISEIKFSAATPSAVATGLVGWVSAVVNDSLRVDGITVRRTRAGRLSLSFPAKLDRAGRQHALVCPVDDEARRDIERQILRALPTEEIPSP